VVGGVDERVQRTIDTDAVANLGLIARARDPAARGAWRRSPRVQRTVLAGAITNFGPVAKAGGPVAYNARRRFCDAYTAVIAGIRRITFTVGWLAAEIPHAELPILLAVRCHHTGQPLQSV
jgi:hypothetical protein